LPQSQQQEAGMTATDTLEEQIAHLTRSVEDLSDVVTRQQREIDGLTRRLALLVDREAEREYDSGGSIPLADQVPPHY